MQVWRIEPVESVAVDHGQLSLLYAQLGQSGAEDVVCRALEELAMRLSQSEAHYRGRDWARLRKNARSLIAIAEQLGMSALSRVAGDVTTAIDQGDANAVSATLSRLLRVGERSLTVVWDIQDFAE